MNTVILDNVTIEECKAAGRILHSLGCKTNLMDEVYSSVSEQIRAHVSTYVDGTNWSKTIRECKKYEKAVRSGFMDAALES